LKKERGKTHRPPSEHEFSVRRTWTPSDDDDRFVARGELRSGAHTLSVTVFPSPYTYIHTRGWMGGWLLCFGSRLSHQL
jgi:hypothetical protein